MIKSVTDLGLKMEGLHRNVREFFCDYQYGLYYGSGADFMRTWIVGTLHTMCFKCVYFIILKWYPDKFDLKTWARMLGRVRHN